MAYLLNDFTGLLIGALLVFTTFEVVHKLTPNRYTNVLEGIPIESCCLYLATPFGVWYFYQLLLRIGPKGTSKAIKI